MAETKELLLFVPGMGARPQSHYAGLLATNLQAYCADHGIAWESGGDAEEDGKECVRLRLGFPDGTARTIDLRTVHWSDLLPSLAKASVASKVGNGLLLLKYWVFSASIWRVINSNKYLILQSLMTIAFMVVWYYGVLALGIMALGASTDLQQATIPQWVHQGIAWLGFPPFAEQATVGGVLQTLGGSMFGFSAIVIGYVGTKTIDVSAVADSLYASKHYLQNVNGVRHGVCARLGKWLLAARTEDPPYDRITVFAHSFGAVPAVEALAELAQPPQARVRFVTAGSPLLLVTARSARVREAVFAVQGASYLAAWEDYYAHDDWLCTAIPLLADAERVRTREITSTASVFDILSGKSHDLYFTDALVLQTLVAG